MLSSRLALLTVFAGFLLASPAHAQEASPARPAEAKPVMVARITPSGEDAYADRQIVIEFNRPLVPLGRMEREKEEIPVTITPEVNCLWRWLNTKTLACQLKEEEQLMPSTAYQVTVKPGIHAEDDGGTLEEPYEHSFITYRPDTRYVRVGGWESPSRPQIFANFNQPVTRESVAKFLFISPANTMDKMASLKVLHPDELRKEGESSDEDAPEAGQEEKKQKKINPRTIKTSDRWILVPDKELGLDGSYSLRVTKGLVPEKGSETGVAERQALQFDTFPEFAFLGIRCRPNDNEEMILVTPENAADAAKCGPLSGVALSFSRPVMNSEAKTHLAFTPDLAGGRKDYDPWAGREDYSRLNYAHEKGRSYDVWLPEFLKANREYRLQTTPPELSWWEKVVAWFTDELPRQTELRDEFGELLAEPVNLTFFTDNRKPNYELPNTLSVLEKGVDAAEVPLFVNNLEGYSVSYQRQFADSHETNLSLQREVAKVNNIQYAVPLGIREMLENRSGIVFGTLATTPEVTGKSENERLIFGQVTPFQVQVKAGHFNTLVWVTDMATGQPVSDVEVTLYKGSVGDLKLPEKTLTEGTTDGEGIALLKGIEAIDPNRDSFGWGCYLITCERLLVRVRKGEDIALLPLHHPFEMDVYRASGNTIWGMNMKRHGHMHSWGFTAQGVYRAGDTMQYKLYVRNQDNTGYVLPERKGYRLTLTDPTGKKVFRIKNIELNEFGAYSGEYTFAKTAPVGWYRFELEGPKEFSRYFVPMEVLVSDFTPSPFKVQAEFRGKAFKAGDKVEMLTTARLHSGGPYGEAEARISLSLDPASFQAKSPKLKGFLFDSGMDERGTRLILEETRPLNAQGELESAIAPQMTDVVYGKLLLESAVSDDRGKRVASSASVPYFGVDRLVGIRSKDWLLEQGKPASVEVAVSDTEGKPVSGVTINGTVQVREVKAARVKGAGNVYETRTTESWKDVATCRVTSSESPVLCPFTPDQPGSYRITAEITDSKGRKHRTLLYRWATGTGEYYWAQGDDNALPIEPEQESYTVGETARYLVKNPYPGAKALVTLERYGVLKQWVQRLEGSTPVLEIPVTAELAPGFFLSVAVLSPRVEKPLGDANKNAGEIDLGKPAFRMGYTQTMVTHPGAELKLKLSTDKEQYRPGETVTATVKLAVGQENTVGNQPVEVAITVLDEAVLDLIQGGRDYFNPMRGFYRLDGLDVENYSLITRLVGRQKFEKKGANPGGDGGAGLAMRNNFRFVSYWNGSLTLNDKGEGSFTFPVPDNLTGWRILAVAVTPSRQMGLSDSRFTVNRPTEARPVMPNQIMEGDQFLAGFNVMNRMDKPRTLTVEITASGLLGKDKNSKGLKQRITLKPYQRQNVFLPVTAGIVPADRDTPEGEIRFRVKVWDEEDGDALEHTVPVKKYRTLQVAASYGSLTEGKAEERLTVPAGIYPDIGALSVTLSPTVLGNLSGAFRYMRDYPYLCWEQKLSKAVMAARFTSLQPYLPEKLTWKGSDSLPQSTLELAANYQAPNGGMVFFLPQNEYVNPYLSAFTALAFQWLREDGLTPPQNVEAKLHGYLQRLLKEEVLPTSYSAGMASTVRAVALAALTRTGKADRAEVERFLPHVKQMSLFGQAMYLQAALQAGNDAALIKQVANGILSQSNETGGKISFNEQPEAGEAQLLTSPLRTQCAVLSALSRYAATEAGSTAAGELPAKLARFITQTRGGRDHWENTQENLFCMQALQEYARVYEAAPVQATVTATAQLGEQPETPLGEATFGSLKDEPHFLKRSLAASDEGQKGSFTLNHSGSGRIYYQTLLSYASKGENRSETVAGIEVKREYSMQVKGKDGKPEWKLLPLPLQLKRGDLVRVDIYLSLPGARNFVVVDDPVPGGLEALNRDLATTSAVDADKAKFQAAGGSFWFERDNWQSFAMSFWSFYHQEIRHDAVRFYADYLQKGNYHLSYMAQAIAEGEFKLPPTRAEEMYNPDVYGLSAPASLEVKASAPLEAKEKE
jgi:uncharacterized protein YfaS (alpha-2-macroglobulin family)